MYKLLLSHIRVDFHQLVSAAPIGLFRVLFGLITLQEIFFLNYFHHLIFDPIPFMDMEFPMIHFFIWIWGAVAACLMVGYHSQFAALANYAFWIVFVNFTPMHRDFDGGFDAFMIGANFFLLFMPIDKRFSLDELRRKLNQPFEDSVDSSSARVSGLAVTLPVTICLGFLYFDSAIHKMFAEHWRNGLGAWLPASMPYYISALDFSWWLNQESLQKVIGYGIIVFQFTFIFCWRHRWLQPAYFLFGAGLHLGITLVLNIYPFGLGMLIFYALVAPSDWYQAFGRAIKCPNRTLTVFFDEQCPLCRRTVIILRHFDICAAIDFKGMQTYANQYTELSAVDDELLLRDLYALDGAGKLYAGIDTYAQILKKMRYPYPVGLLLTLPGVRTVAAAVYRRIADNRIREACQDVCPIPKAVVIQTWYDKLFVDKSQPQLRRTLHKVAKCFLLMIAFQVNSSLHYGLVYRLNIDTGQSAATRLFSELSNSVALVSTSFFGITPHALYLHDHFAGYNQLVAITYIDPQGDERWLPFVDQQGRMLAPNWGRVHSMWANIAVTPKIDRYRLRRAVMRVTAFWGIKLGLDLNSTTFRVKVKNIVMPFSWEKDLLQRNLSGIWETCGEVAWRGKEADVAFYSPLRVFNQSKY